MSKANELTFQEDLIRQLVSNGGLLDTPAEELSDPRNGSERLLESEYR